MKKSASASNLEQHPRERNEMLPALESVLCTDELNRRPSRPPDYETESHALTAMAQALVDSPRTIFQTLADTILRIFRCGSAGVSLVTEDGKRFHWPAIAGEWKPHIGGGTPRDFGPCGDVLDRNCPLLFRHFERRYSYLQPMTPPVEECLLVPFYVAGMAVGTVWAITHDEIRKFNSEDLRMLIRLGTFASTAFQMVKQSHTSKGHADESVDAELTLREMNEALIVSSIRQQELAERAQKTEAALRESYAQFAGLFDASPVGMYLVDSQLRIRLISPSARAVFGDFWEGGGELLGSDFVEVIHILWSPKVASEVVARFRHTLATGEPYVSPEFIEERYDRKVREYYDWQIHRMLLADGQFGVVCYFIDISARVLAAHSLRESEVRFRRLFQSSKDGILILDAITGKIIDANAFMSGMLGRDLPQLIGRELHEIGMFEDEQANKSAFVELQRNSYIRYDHLPVQKPNGEITQVEFISNVYFENRRMMAQCNVRDISARVGMERKIHEQTAALTLEHRRKDEFLAMLSHELRNPLAPIRNAAYLLAMHDRGNENPIQKQAREVIERQVTQLTRLVSDLLEISRIVTGRIKLRLETVDMRLIVRHALETARPVIDRQRHKLKLTIPEEPVWVQADPTRLEEVVVNLLTNAAKYTDPAGSIEVGLEQLGTEALLRVRDSGIGIAPSLLPHIFDLFTQADQSLDRSQGGLGIGLSVVKRLVELQQGAVEAFSEGLGKGSEFIVRLPVAIRPELLPLEPAVAAECPVAGLRILAVDDNVDACLMMGQVLRILGHEVKVAHSGSGALEAAVAWRPDVVLLDIGLPVMDGYEVARRIRATPELNNTRLIALTGYGTDGDILLAREAGFEAHMLKPVEIEKLEKLLAVGSEPRSIGSR